MSLRGMAQLRAGNRSIRGRFASCSKFESLFGTGAELPVKLPTAESRWDGLPWDARGRERREKDWKKKCLRESLRQDVTRREAMGGADWCPGEDSSLHGVTR